jgi:sigma-B regulation protein RsbU (phosphoserine phosphatase)
MLTGRLREEVTTALLREREKERWSQDLARAREIQLGMLPSGEFILDDIEIAGVCSPASEVGGDFYDYFCPRGDSLGLIVGDVTGHGFYAGLFVAMAKSCLHTQAQFSFGPRSIMEAMRRTLDLSIIQRRLLMSCCYVLFEPSQRRLHYANAGHPYPYVYRPGTRELERLAPLDPILGALDACSGCYTERSQSWQPGDVLVMYTDGVTEARNGSGEMFDHHGLEACIAAQARGSAADIKDSILASVSKHAGGRGPDDDLTLVVVKAR